MAEVPCVLVCAGRSCRKAKGFEEMRRSLDELANVKTVKCVDVCDGPVIGVKMDGKTVWFERLRSDKVRAAVAVVLAKHKMPKRLRAHRVS